MGSLVPVVQLVASRLVRLVGVLLLVSVLAFLALRLTPGDPASLMIGPNSGRADLEEALARLRAEMRLDQPLPVQYLEWLKGIVTGDLGESNRSGVPVWSMIGHAAPVTAWLIGLSVLVAVPISIVLGLLGAAYRTRLGGRTVRLVATLALAAPAFWVGLVLIDVFSVRLGVLPSGGYVSPFEEPGEFLRHMVLPVAALSTFLIGTLTRYVYAEAIDVLRQPYIRTARASGLPEWLVLVRFAARNALIPLIAVTGIQMGALVGGAVLSEQVFGLPGLGQLILAGVLGRDYQVVQGAVVITTLAVVVVTALADITYRLVDPRLRA